MHTVASRSGHTDPFSSFLRLYYPKQEVSSKATVRLPIPSHAFPRAFLRHPAPSISCPVLRHPAPPLRHPAPFPMHPYPHAPPLSVHTPQAQLAAWVDAVNAGKAFAATLKGLEADARLIEQLDTE